MEAQRRVRRIVGVALLVSAGILLLMAILIYTGVFSMDPSVRGPAAGAIGVAALIDAMVGIRFLQNASTS